ncbi:MAG: extracellular solute-binding protein [Acidobacteriota bacterium]
MVATAQRFSELNPSIDVHWEKRSLQEFADYPIRRLAESFDCLIIDHPFVGLAAADPVVLPLDDYVSNDFLQEHAQFSVGKSHESYQYGGRQWALAIDAAAPVSCWRADLLERHHLSLPRTWEQLVAIAKSGKVVFPCAAVDCLMHFFMLCSSLGETPGSQPWRLVTEDVGIRALELLTQLLSYCTSDVFDWNPIRTYEVMTTCDNWVYCPFGFGYSNYSRRSYARAQLEFGELVQLSEGKESSTTLGGAGLAISAQCPHREAAVDYACFVASAECQRTIYAYSGGQPAHRSAWTDSLLNDHCRNFFVRTLATMDRAHIRPRHNGYISFQENAGVLIHACLRNNEDLGELLTSLQRLYEQSLCVENQKMARN